MLAGKQTEDRAHADASYGLNTTLPEAPKRTKKKADSPALVAARERNAEAIRSFAHKELREAKDHNGCSCLHWAAGNGDIEICQFLIDEVGISPHELTWNRRTPLHYAARNGQLEVSKWLVSETDAEADPQARDDVTPFQMAVWQNQHEVCSWLVEQAGVDPCQVNRFNCNAGHWLATAPKDRAGNIGSGLIPLARCLTEHQVDFSAIQSHGHNALHKAAWSGHQALCMWLRDELGLWDAIPDNAGNYAADLADLQGHEELAAWLRACCSGSRLQSCAILGVGVDADPVALRTAYLERVRLAHPDSHLSENRHSIEEFSALHQAYRHLSVHKGAGSQHNIKHSILLALPPYYKDCDAEIDDRNTALVAEGTVAGEETTLQTFKTRLIAVISDFGQKGFPVSLLRRRYAQVWRGCSFPTPADFGITRKSVGLVEMLQLVASDAIRIELFSDGRQPLLYAIIH